MDTIYYILLALVAFFVVGPVSPLILTSLSHVLLTSYALRVGPSPRPQPHP